jgi:hypothetical protein
MTKTGLSVVTAVALSAVSLGTALGRWYVLGNRHFGGSVWKVTLAATGELNGGSVSLTMSLPPDFRHQHILDERFHSRELVSRPSRAKAGRREVVWHPARLGGAGPFRLTTSFRCLMVRRPTAAMARMTHDLDAEPGEGVALKPGPRIESDDKKIQGLARDLVSEHEAQAPVDQVQALFNHVSDMQNEPALAPLSARECLRNGGGDSGGKSRLLVALCRNRGIPTRLLAGLILAGDRETGPHFWAEAWVNGHWLPLCPTYHHFGPRKFPTNYLVLHVGDDDFLRIRGGQVQYGFVTHDLHDEADQGDEPPSLGKAFWHQFSLQGLKPAEQTVVKFLLLLPLGALIVTIFRTVIGVSTFGTFSPALLGLAFLDLKALPLGLGIFVLTVFVGWAMRHLLERFHLLLVSRVSALLTLVVLFLIVVIVAASRSGVMVTQYIALFPLVILTHLVERFWTVEAEDGTGASFKTLLGTLAVAVTVSLALAPYAVTAWMFHFPETLGLVLAAQFLLGRYTGYRLSELYRFGDLVPEEQLTGGRT